MGEGATDFELLQQWGQGDRPAGARLFGRYFDALFRFFENKIQDGVEDLVQQTLLACIEGRARLRREASFRGYMFQAARFQLYAHYRKRTGKHELDFDLISLADLGTSPTGVLARKQEERCLLEALRRIPLNYQLVLELRLWEELPTGEIATILEIAEPTVHSRLHRATDCLRREMTALAGREYVLPDTADDLQAWAQRLREAAQLAARADE